MRAKHAALAAAFTSMVRPGHAFAAASNLRMIKMLDAEIMDLEAQSPTPGMHQDQAVVPSVLPGVFASHRRQWPGSRLLRTNPALPASR